MKRVRGRIPPGKDLLSLAWRVPLYSVPFALFFLITTGSPFRTFGLFYSVSLAFSGASLFGVWLTHHFLAPMIVDRFPDDPRLTWKISALHAGMAILFSAAMAAVLHFTIMPGFLGSGRAVLTLVTYFALFGMLFVGLALAFNFYRQAMERAGSERELILARRIQESFLLSEFPRRSRLECQNQLCFLLVVQMNHCDGKRLLHQFTRGFRPCLKIGEKIGDVAPGFRPSMQPHLRQRDNPQASFRSD